MFKQIYKIILKDRDVISFLAVFIFVIGLIIRFYAAINFSLWLDEASYYFISQNKLIDLILLNHWNDSQPPLYTLILHFWQRYNTSELFLRLPSLLFSAVTLFIAYQLGKRIKDRYFGVTLLIIFSFSNFLIHLSWQANVYALSIMFVLISTYYYFLKLKNLTSALCLICFNILGILSDYSFVWLIVSFSMYEFLNFLVIYRKRKKYFTDQKYQLVVLEATFLFILMWVMLTFNRIPHALSLASWYTGEEMIQKTLTALIGISKQFDSVTILIICLMLAGIIIGWNGSDEKSKKFKLFTASAIFTPFFTAYLFSILVQPIMLARHLNVTGIALLFASSLFIYPYRSFISVLVISAFVFLNIKNFREYNRDNISLFNWKTISPLVFESIKSSGQEQNIFLDIADKQYQFQPLIYYLGRYYNKNSIIWDNAISVPDDTRNYLNVDSNNRATKWLFDFNHDKSGLEKSSRNLNCGKLTKVESTDINYIQCE